MQMNQQNNVERIGGLAARQKSAVSGKTEVRLNTDIDSKGNWENSWNNFAYFATKS